MKKNQSKISHVIFPIATLLFCLFASPVIAEEDLLDKEKSDTAVKMLVFPKSLRVIESPGNIKANPVFSDPKIIRRTLLKLDPARIAPAKPGEPLTGPVNRVSLSQISSKYNEDVIFIFRRTLDKGKSSIHHQGLLYLAKQKKILALKESSESVSGSLQEIDLAGLKALAREAKKVLHSYKFEKRQSAY